MPESPDFDELVRRISSWYRDDHSEIIDPSEALRQVWNARGAADLRALDPILGANMDHEYRAIKSLDR